MFTAIPASRRFQLHDDPRFTVTAGSPRWRRGRAHPPALAGLPAKVVGNEGVTLRRGLRGQPPRTGRCQFYL